jgi:hypothetical protein
MRAAGIIGARREGRQVFYRIAAESPVTILNCIRRQHHAASQTDAGGGYRRLRARPHL